MIMQQPGLCKSCRSHPLVLAVGVPRAPLVYGTGVTTVQVATPQLRLEGFNDMRNDMRV